ncbi:MAG: hypothetical protein ACOYXM_11390 [Actinomycetota bacterium]
MRASATCVRRALGLAITTALWVGLANTPAGAQEDPPNSDFDVEYRDLLVIDQTGSALDTGGGLTLFGVELEGEDECPGDSTHDGYRVDSYMVPLDVDPTRLDFSGTGPYPTQFREYGTFQMPLVTAEGNRFAAELTGDAFQAGGPGPIRDLPGFDFRTYVPTAGIEDWDGGVPAGVYRVGFACTFNGRITNLWETTIEVAGEPTDEPVGMRWTVTGPQPRELETAPSNPTAVIVGLIGLALVLAVAGFALHRSSQRAADPGLISRAEETLL